MNHTAAVDSTGARVNWIDAARGVAIVLLLVFHSTVVHAYVAGDGPARSDPVNIFLAALRMPALMFLSGVVLSRSLSRPLPQYYGGKLRNIAWPYILWAALLLNIAGFEYFYYHYLSDPTSWLAPGYLWFIFYLLVFYLVAPLLLRFLPAWSIPVALVVATFALDNTGLPVENVAFYATFFFAGHALSGWITGGRIAPQSLGRGGPAAVIVALAVCGIAAGVASVASDWRLTASPLTLPLSLGGVLAFCFLMRRVGSARFLSAVRWAGRNSIVLYLAHWPVMVVTARLLRGTELDRGWYPPVLFATALAVGAVLILLRRWPPVRWLFSAPRPLATIRNRSRREPAPVLVRDEVA